MEASGKEEAKVPGCSTRCLFFFFNDTATTEIYTLSLHDALPIFPTAEGAGPQPGVSSHRRPLTRSEERFSRNAETDIVCRLLLEKKNKKHNHYTTLSPHIQPLTPQPPHHS